MSKKLLKVPCVNFKTEAHTRLDQITDNDYFKYILGTCYLFGATILTIVLSLYDKYILMFILLAIACYYIRFVFRSANNYSKLAGIKKGKYPSLTTTDEFTESEEKLYYMIWEYNILAKNWNYCVEGHNIGHAPIPKHLHDYGNRLFDLYKKLTKSVETLEYERRRDSIPKVNPDRLILGTAAEELDGMRDEMMDHQRITHGEPTANLQRALDLEAAQTELDELAHGPENRAAEREIHATTRRPTAERT